MTNLYPDCKQVINLRNGRIELYPHSAIFRENGVHTEISYKDLDRLVWANTDRDEIYPDVEDHHRDDMSAVKEWLEEKGAA